MQYKLIYFLKIFFLIGSNCLMAKLKSLALDGSFIIYPAIYSESFSIHSHVLHVLEITNNLQILWHTTVFLLLTLHIFIAHTFPHPSFYLYFLKIYIVLISKYSLKLSSSEKLRVLFLDKSPLWQTSFGSNQVLLPIYHLTFVYTIVIIKLMTDIYM